MHKYSKETTKYKDIPNDAQVLTTLDKYDSNETENSFDFIISIVSTILKSRNTYFSIE